MSKILKAILTTAFILKISIATADDISVPMDRAKSGNLYVKGVINHLVTSDFLLDTGAGMVTVTRDVLKQIKKSSKVTKVRDMAARLANGKLTKMDVYKIESFTIGQNCDLGEMEVAVVGNKGRNILGLSALGAAAPFAVHINPLKLVLSGCPAAMNTIADNSKPGPDKHNHIAYASPAR